MPQIARYRMDGQSLRVPMPIGVYFGAGTRLCGQWITRYGRTFCSNADYFPKTGIQRLCLRSGSIVGPLSRADEQVTRLIDDNPTPIVRRTPISR